MNDVVGRQGDVEVTTTIDRLYALDRALRNAVDGFRVPRADQNMRSIFERRLRLHPEFERVVVGAEYERAARELIASIEESAAGIARRCGQPWRRGRPDSGGARQDHVGGKIWILGAVEFLIEERPILRGDIELRRTEPIAPGLPDVVVEYLVTVPGTRDQLTRETHGHWGYHYHYLDSRNRRSDTLLTFDRDSPSGIMPTLSWERHAEGQKFKARAAMWGIDKRESVYSVCRPDTLRFSLGDFKQPASDAEVVWPLTAKMPAICTA
ncbi:hypothetical protein BN2476_960002 [Paraburkholderia piptadeniae]|uniref:Uncharacterized protein n=1 Tax=Paraburkholderia piptadeniae TaxID=1701573 RepID=A0A1N7STN8_9BURK|nr:hypothetical protein BN2476_960002 [Paraburkholderia piptadeniae]